MNSFDVLGIPVGTPADSDTTKQAWRRLSLEFHPDKNDGSKIAEWYFIRVQIAYAQIRSGIGGDIIEPLLAALPTSPRPIPGLPAAGVGPEPWMPPEPPTVAVEPPEPVETFDDTEPEAFGVFTQRQHRHRPPRGRYNTRTERQSNKRPWTTCLHAGCTEATQWTYCPEHRNDVAGDVFG